MFRNILVAVDASPTAEAALEDAVDLARDHGARLVLISVAAPPRFRYSGPLYVPYPTEDDLERAACDVVERAESLVPADVPVTGVVRRGRPATAIVTQAEQGGHDLVVVGSRGYGLVASLLLASVSRAVSARSPVPVLVVRRRSERSRPTPGRRARREVRAAEPPAALAMQAEPVTKGGLAVFLWLVAALLLELELVLWMFDRMYAP